MKDYGAGQYDHRRLQEDRGSELRLKARRRSSGSIPCRESVHSAAENAHFPAVFLGGDPLLRVESMHYPRENAYFPAVFGWRSSFEGGKYALF